LECGLEREKLWTFTKRANPESFRDQSVKRLLGCGVPLPLISASYGRASIRIQEKKKGDFNSSHSNPRRKNGEPLPNAIKKTTIVKNSITNAAEKSGPGDTTQQAR